MYPRRLQPGGGVTGSEVKVFELLEAGLSDEWEVFHSVSSIVRDHAEGASDSETDFVLCHPQDGIVCLEVKGGGIECQHGTWYRKPPNGAREQIKDPFLQALDNRYALERKLAEEPRLAGKNLLIVHAVLFPYITIHQLALAPDAPREILLDRNDAEDIAAAVERVLAYHRGSRDKRVAPGAGGVAAIRDLLAPQIDIPVPMGALFPDEEEQLIKLTREQGMLLNRMRRDLRMVVTGCAGSGKTTLAVEHARRLAHEGQRVLFVCFNRALREHLAKTSKVDGLDFYTFHGLCTRMAKVARVELPNYGDAEVPQEYWDEVLPEALVEAIDEIGAQYDAIFVDEAQDLRTEWLTALMYTLRDESTNPVWLFMDDNQRVYDARLEAPHEFRPFDLTVNCRNTQTIHREVIKKYDGAVVPEAKGPEGRPLDFIQANDQVAAVEQAIERLCRDEEIPPQDVAVLSSHGFDNSEVAQRLAGRFKPTKERGKLGDHVHVSSIRSFKGLEAPAVVLCELEDVDEATFDQQLYVGLSRAKNHCVVVAPKAAD